MLEANQAAPEFTLADAAGENRSLEQILTSGPVVFAFFKISCPVCQFALPFLNRLREGGKLQIIGISQDDAELTNRFLDEHTPGMPALLDDGGQYEVSNAFGITHVPSMFLVEPGGQISWALDGFSKAEFEKLGERAGAAPFRADDDYVPEWKAG